MDNYHTKTWRKIDYKQLPESFRYWLENYPNSNIRIYEYPRGAMIIVSESDTISENRLRVLAKRQIPYLERQNRKFDDLTSTEEMPNFDTHLKCLIKSKFSESAKLYGEIKDKLAKIAPIVRDLEERLFDEMFMKCTDGFSYPFGVDYGILRYDIRDWLAAQKDLPKSECTEQELMRTMDHLEEYVNLSRVFG